LKKVKHILLRTILYLTAFQVLNLSIDSDYIITQGFSIVSSDFDDIDSFGEYVLEKVLGDNQYTSEDNDDTGSPFNKALDEFGSGLLYYESHIIPKPLPNSTGSSSWFAGLDLANRTCGGYRDIITPPPDKASTSC
jgi:hypothetical protein